MMTEESPPAWFGLLRADIATMEERIMARIDALVASAVTKDLFEAEQRNHAERHRLMEERLREETAARVAASKHASDRVTALEEQLDQRVADLDAQMERTEESRKTAARRMWVGIWSVLSGAVLALGTILTAVEGLIHH